MLLVFNNGFCQAQQQLDKVDKQFFIENKGQWDSEVLFMTKHHGVNTWITKSGVTYDYFKMETNETQNNDAMQIPKSPHLKNKDNIKTRLGHVVRYSLSDASSQISTQPINKQNGYYNYFKGNDQSKWASKVALYGEVNVSGNYPNITTRYYYEDNNLRYDYIVKPGGNPSQIKFILEGANDTYIKQADELAYTTRFGEQSFSKLYSYQIIAGIKKTVASKFIKTNDGVYSIEVSEYNSNYDLIIDPIIYSTTIGGISSESGTSIATNGAGDVFICGSTASTNFPTTIGAYQTYLLPPSSPSPAPIDFIDGFVTKLDVNGNIDWSTYIGGSAGDILTGLALNSLEDVHLSGYTTSSDFPIFGPSGGTYGGDGDAIMTQLSSTGAWVNWSIYINGAEEEEGRAIAIDNLDNCYVTGVTRSTTMPGFSGINNGNHDAFLAKADAIGNYLSFDFIGGSDYDEGNAIAVENINANTVVAMTGATHSVDFPVTNGSVLNGIYHDAFIYTCNEFGIIQNSTYIGGSNSQDQGEGIDIAANGNIYITGWTYPFSATFPNYPTTAGVCLSSSPVVSNINGFVTAFDPFLSLSPLPLYSTFLGGSVFNVPLDLKIDNNQNINIFGYTYSPNYPVTNCAVQATYHGDIDAFYTKYNPTLGCPIYSTFLGGSFQEIGFELATDATNVYLCGETSSFDFPTTLVPFSGGLDAFVTKITKDLPITSSSNSPVCEGGTLQFSATGGVSYQWNGPNSFSSTLQNPCIGAGCTPPTTLSLAAAGNYTVVVTDAAGCTGSHVVNVVVTSFPDPCLLGAILLPPVINFSPGIAPVGYRIATNTIIPGGANVTFDHINIGIENGASITVQSSATLTITNSHLLACKVMWRGIIVEPGARLFIQNNALIEDAIVAVDITNTSSATLVDITQAIFNKNHRGVVIQNYNATTTYPFSIRGSVFTCRNLRADCFSWPYWYTVPQLKATTTPINNVSTPYTMQYAPITTLLGIPLPTRCFKHINLNNVGQTTLTGVAPTFYQMNIGAATSDDLNIFEIADIGIDAVNSNFSNINAVFQNMPNPPDHGIGIRAAKNPNAGTSTFIAQQYRAICAEVVSGNFTYVNTFYDCFIGFQSSDYYSHIVNSNEFYSTQSKALLQGSGVSKVNLNTIGRKAIDILSRQYYDMTINDNKIYNHTVGIHQVSGIYGSAAGSSSILLGFKNIRENNIQDVPSSINPPVDPFIGDGIIVSMVNGSGSSSAPVSGVNAFFINYVFANNIINAFRGISYANFNYSFLENHINGNRIILMQDKYPDLNQIGIQTTLNNRLQVHNNFCRGIGATLINPDLSRFTAYQSELNSNQTIDCNSSERIFTGYKFLGFNPQTYWIRNQILNKHYYGMSLGETLAGSTVGGIIGTQGSVGSAIDNVWNGAFTWHTYVNPNANAANSRLWVRNNAAPPIIYRPTLNDGPGTQSYNAPGNLQTATGPANPIPCDAPQPIIGPTPPNGDVVDLLEKVVQNQILYPTYPDENEWMAKQRSYELQWSDSPYVNATTVLDNFYTTNHPVAMAKIHDIENLIDAGNFTAAQNMANSIMASNAIEQNYKDYYNIALPYFNTGVWNTATDNPHLYAIANKCLFTQGAIISNARVLYNAINRNDYVVFNDECQGVTQNGSGQQRLAAKKSYLSFFDVELYPNPMNNFVTIKSNFNKTSSISVIIQNIQGQKVLQKDCNLEHGNSLLNFQVPNGHYLVTIQNNATGEIVYKKLTVNK